MRNLKILIILIVVISALVLPSAAKKSGPKPLIQMAILLDTSGSMEGLIEQAKTQLWKIVNEMALAKQRGVTPRLEVALYEYGKSSIPASEDYLRMIVPLSVDLDQISEELFKLRTNGGSEYCGTVIQSAVKGLNWSKSNGNLKVIFIAGNEPFTQGHVDYKVACKESISNGIIVNTIFCGNYNQGINTQWKNGADLADGKYINIDHNQKVAHISAPQDKEIVALGRKLNKTYVAYGKGGRSKKMRQAKQDNNAAGVSESVMVQRSVTKASKQYNNAAWDLLDAEKEGKVKVEEMDEAALPEEMKKMNKKERREYLDKKKKERQELQKKITKLRKERDKYVAEQRKTKAGKETLDEAIIRAIRTQAEKKKYKFEKK
ncbi:MAG: VWA domain-containing protein [bacterium]|nr:VWA domain-containing protein [bacterium]